jgi:hypothetical protein
MRILYRLMAGTALLSLPYFTTAQVTKATDDYAQAFVNSRPITIRVLDNDSVAIGRRLKVDYIPLVNHGTARISPDSTAILFTPARDFKGIALVNYTIADGSGTFDCGLVVVDVAATPTPNRQEMNLFTRKGRPVRFTIPDGFVPTSSPQGATVEMVNGYTGVYQFVSHPNLIGVFPLLFNKLENGVTKEFHVIVEVLNAPASPVYLKDHNHSIAINGSKTIDLFKDMLTYPTANVASVKVSPGENCTVVSIDPSNNRESNYTVFPYSNFKGTLQFNYTITYANGFEESATVHVIVSNFAPALSEFTITALANEAGQELPYKVPADFTQHSFDVGNGLTQNGGVIAYTQGRLLYSAPQSNATTDAFSLRYCIDGVDCTPIEVKVKLIHAPNACVNGKCVWSGDANQDGRVDIADIFPIGDNMGQYGFKRTNALTGWFPQSADNWRTLSEIADPKYADTNGDGMINVSDTAAIMKYYGNASTIYPERTAEESRIQTYLVSSATSAKKGDMIEILVMLGSSEFPALDTRGLSFSVDYSAQKVSDTSLVVDFGRFNWLSRYDAYLTASKIPVSGTVDAAIVRSRDRGASGHGEVGKIRAIVVDDVVGVHEGDKPVVRFKLKDAVLETSKGRFMKVKGSEIVIPLESGSSNAPVKETDLVLYPNPTSDFAEFYLNGSNKIQSVRILDMRGRDIKRLSNVNGKQTRIDMSDVPNGLYMAEVMTENGRVVKKLQVIK